MYLYKYKLIFITLSAILKSAPAFTNFSRTATLPYIKHIKQSYKILTCNYLHNLHSTKPQNRIIYNYSPSELYSITYTQYTLTWIAATQRGVRPVSLSTILTSTPSVMSPSNVSIRPAAAAENKSDWCIH